MPMPKWSSPKKVFSSVTSSRALTRTSKSGHFPAAEEAECRLIKSPHLDQYHRRSNKLLRRMVNNRNRTGAPAFAIP
jgi:hypothetical protein